MRIKIVLDTSSLITLGLIDMLLKCLRIFELITTKGVIKELLETSKYKDSIGRSAKSTLKLIKQNKVKIYKVKNKEKVKNLLSSDIGVGEAECVVCCMENHISLLIIDDVDAMYALEDLAVAKSIETNISIWLLAQLSNNKIITKNEVIKAIKKLIKIREWEGGVLETLAKQYLE